MLTLPRWFALSAVPDAPEPGRYVCCPVSDVDGERHVWPEERLE